MRVEVLQNAFPEQVLPDNPHQPQVVYTCAEEPVPVGCFEILKWVGNTGRSGGNFI